MNLNDLPIEDLIQLCHDQAHEATHDYEDTVVMALTKRDVWIFGMAILVATLDVPCLGEECADLVERLAELLDTQKPGWRQIGS